MDKRISSLLTRWLGAVALVAPFLVSVSLAAGPTHLQSHGQAHAAQNKGIGTDHIMPPAYGLLREAAYETAVFNAGWDKPVTGYPARLSYQMLYVAAPGTNNNTGGTCTDWSNCTFYVKPGTRLYVPLMYNNDIPAILGGSLTPLGDQAALLDYWYSQDKLGFKDAMITVDDRETSLSPGYLVDIGFDPAVTVNAPFPQPMGRYQVVAPMLTPLPKGTHTVRISGAVSGAYWDEFGGGWSFAITYTVIVK